MSKGHDAENALFYGLARRGFMLRRGEILDEDLKTDFVVIAHPGAWEGHFYPSPIAVQVTTALKQEVKRLTFVESACTVANQLAYIELALFDSELSESMIHAVGTALIHLFRDASTPRFALVSVNGSRYDIEDLQDKINHYRRSLQKKIDGEISGRIVRWDNQRQFGFAEAEVTGMDGRRKSLTFFVHMRAVTDEDLKTILWKLDGDLKVADCIPIIFLDGGCDETKKRKKASDVRKNLDNNRTATRYESYFDSSGASFFTLDLSLNNFRSEMFRFRARRSRNFEAYTQYLLRNFCKAVAEI
ncbi:MAG: hypothetical protein Q7S48_02605 [bacterium]|nr:hypothetical protein [bacterium]